MEDFRKQVELRFNQLTEEILRKEKELKLLREERLPLADMLDRWGIVKKKKRTKP